MFGQGQSAAEGRRWPLQAEGNALTPSVSANNTQHGVMALSRPPGSTVHLSHSLFLFCPVWPQTRWCDACMYLNLQLEKETLTPLSTLCCLCVFILVNYLYSNWQTFLDVPRLWSIRSKIDDCDLETESSRRGSERHFKCGTSKNHQNEQFCAESNNSSCSLMFWPSSRSDSRWIFVLSVSYVSRNASMKTAEKIIKKEM